MSPIQQYQMELNLISIVDSYNATFKINDQLSPEGRKSARHYLNELNSIPNRKVGNRYAWLKMIEYLDSTD